MGATLLVAVHRLLIEVASLVAKQAPGHEGSAVVAYESSYPMACGIFPDQASNPCPLLWRVNS